MSQNKHSVSRRNLLRLSAAGLAVPSALLSAACSREMTRKGEGEVVVIGGGFGGAAAAKYLKRYNPKINVTLIEPKKAYVTCPASNWVIGGLVEMEEITHTYDGLKKHGVNVMHEVVSSVDPQKRVVTLSDGQKVNYDRLIVSPGIDFKWGVHEGVDEDVANIIPHAWKAGDQTRLLRDQLRSMRQGGTFVMVAPPNPFRCPPGPYERAGMVAHYLSKHNPTANILILDQKNKFSKQALFMEGWRNNYGQMIEWVAAMDGGTVFGIDVANKIIDADYGEVKADVINYIPAQKAGVLADQMGLTDESGFCPVNQQTFESKVHPNIHVIGDAAMAGPMPKSGHSAVSQAKICAANVVRSLAELDPISAKNANTCYSLITPDYAISVAAVYDVKDKQIVPVEGAGGVSRMNASLQEYRMEANYTRGWYKSITDEVWG